MAYDYALEKFSKTFKDLQAKRQAITEERDQLAIEAAGIDAQEVIAKEAWLKAESSALINGKTAAAEKTKTALDAVKTRRFSISDRVEVLERAANQIDSTIAAEKESAKQLALEVARADMEKAVVETLKVIRQLAKVQEQELAIMGAYRQAVGSPGLYLIGTTGFFPVVGDENTFGSNLFNLLKTLRSRGYSV